MYLYRLPCIGDGLIERIALTETAGQLWYFHRETVLIVQEHYTIPHSVSPYSQQPPQIIDGPASFTKNVAENLQSNRSSSMYWDGNSPCPVLPA